MVVWCGDVGMWYGWCGSMQGTVRSAVQVQASAKLLNFALMSSVEKSKKRYTTYAA